MKKILATLFILFILVGCSNEGKETDVKSGALLIHTVSNTLPSKIEECMGIE
ncbi:hypothetical protein [Niallia circulans]|uniref:hypothetical protein n=1 Tax=Niallia circulans TaxID=1397 RepID=UPI0026EF1694|nr:hypothetical protein [Niallia circulans]